MAVVPSARAGSPGDPANVVEQMETALNSGNVDAFIAWFAPGGAVKERGGKTFATKEDLRAWAQAVVAHDYHAEHGSRTVTGTRVTWSAKVSFEDLRALGVQSVDSTGEATIVGGKVVSYTPAFCPGSIALLGTASAHVVDERVRAFLEAVVVGGKPEAIDEFVSPQFQDHAPLPGGYPTLDGLRAGIAALRTGFPDLKVTVEDVVPSGDRVAVRLTYAGTNKGSFLGANPSFRQATFSSVDVYRIQDGKFVEHWGLLDVAGLSRQLGIGEAPAAGTSPDAPARKNPPRKEGKGGILGWLM